jgi:hypothetical protein
MNFWNWFAPKPNPLKEIQRSFVLACTSGDLATVRRLLLHHPDLDVNIRVKCASDCDRNSSPLYQALTNGHDDVAAMLLSHPNISTRIRCPFTEIKNARCATIRGVLLLANHPDFVFTNSVDDFTPYLYSPDIDVMRVFVTCMKIFPRDVDNKIKNETYGRHPEQNKKELELMAKDLNKYKRDCTIKYKLRERRAAALFVLIEYVRLELLQSPSDALSHFLEIVLRLPSELQVVICLRHASCPVDVISSQLSDEAYRNLRLQYLLE